MHLPGSASVSGQQTLLDGVVEGNATSCWSNTRRHFKNSVCSAWVYSFRHAGGISDIIFKTKRTSLTDTVVLY